MNDAENERTLMKALQKVARWLAPHLSVEDWWPLGRPYEGTGDSRCDECGERRLELVPCLCGCGDMLCATCWILRADYEPLGTGDD